MRRLPSRFKRPRPVPTQNLFMFNPAFHAEDFWAESSFVGQVFIRLNALQDCAVGGEGLRAGNTRTVDIKCEDTVLQVKQRANIPASYRLMYAGRYLRDDATLAELGVHREATMDVLGQILGGAGGAHTDDNAVAQRHAKLCMDPSVIKGKFGGIEMFDRRLEEMIGHMDVIPIRGIYSEHCLSPDSLVEFSPLNFPRLLCTPCGELDHVVGKEGIDKVKWILTHNAKPMYDERSLVHGRNAQCIAELMEKDEAKGAGLRVEEILALRLCTGKSLFE